MHTSFFQLNSVKKTFSSSPPIDVLSDISYCFEQHASYAIMGVSGTGKSTLMHILAGLEAPTAGEVLLNKVNIYNLAVCQRQQLLHDMIGLVFQESCLIQELSVVENVMLKGLIGNIAYQQAKDHAINLLERVGLADKIYAHPATLSGGQQQRVAIVRAIFNKPVFLLADEPTGNLDEQTGHIIAQVLRECQREWGMGLIVSTHDAYVAHAMQHVLYLKDGQLIQK